MIIARRHIRIVLAAIDKIGIVAAIEAGQHDGGGVDQSGIVALAAVDPVDAAETEKCIRAAKSTEIVVFRTTILIASAVIVLIISGIIPHDRSSFARKPARD